jgi:hypothetical protein
MSSPKPRRLPRRADWIGRRWRREGEWDTRLHRLSNRLTRYMFASQRSVDAEYRGLEVVEARMADIVFAAGAIETSYLRINRITSALARTAMWRPGRVEGVFEMDKQVALSDRSYRLMASVQDAYYDYHAMLWWGRSLLHRVDGDWGRGKGRRLTGLIYYLPESDARLVRAARDRLVGGAFAEVRSLADYSLHAFAVPRPGALLSHQDDGTYALPLPDRLGRRPAVSEKFTFNEGRHIGSESDALWLGVQQFMADVFDVLEQSQLLREDALTGDALKVMQSLRHDLMPPRRTPPALKHPARAH